MIIFVLNIYYAYLLFIFPFTPKNKQLVEFLIYFTSFAKKNNIGN